MSLCSLYKTVHTNDNTFSLLKVCPTFGVPLIKRVIDIFVLDEFCPDPIPGVVFQALDSEVSATNFLFPHFLGNYNVCASASMLN